MILFKIPMLILFNKLHLRMENVAQLTAVVLVQHRCPALYKAGMEMAAHNPVIGRWRLEYQRFKLILGCIDSLRQV